LSEAHHKPVAILVSSWYFCCRRWWSWCP